MATSSISSLLREGTPALPQGRHNPCSVSDVNSAQNRRWAVALLFFFSGGTALIYEVVWSKYLSQMFGSTIQAQTVVLAVFMGGLALGNFLLVVKADKFARPLRVYGFVEGVLGLYAFLFPTIYL